MSLVTLPSHDGGNSARHHPAPATHPTLQACRIRLLLASPGAAASLMRAMERSWSFKGGSGCGDNWLSVIPLLWAQPSRARAGVGVELMAGFHQGLLVSSWPRLSWTVKLATGPGPAHIASTASFARPRVPSALLVTRRQGHPHVSVVSLVTPVE